MTYLFTNDQEIKNESGNPISISKNTTINSAVNPISVDIVGSEVPLLQGKDWYFQVSEGSVVGANSEYRSSYNPNVSTSEESIWVQGGLYPWASWTVAQRIYMISTSTLDTGQQIKIEGLDTNYVYQTETITSNGLTGVPTSLNYIRIFTASLLVDGVTGNNGTITFRLTSGTGTVVANMAIGFCKTKLGQYTIPANKTGYLLNFDATVFKTGANAAAELRMYIREFGGSFRVEQLSQVVNGTYLFTCKVPRKFIQKTDIDFRSIGDSNNTIISCNYSLIIIDN